MRSAVLKLLTRLAITKVVLPSHQNVQGFSDQSLGLDIHAGCGIVEYQDRWVEEKRAGNSDSLTLTAPRASRLALR